MNDDNANHYKPVVKSRTIDSAGREITLVRLEDQRIWDADLSSTIDREYAWAEVLPDPQPVKHGHRVTEIYHESSGWRKATVEEIQAEVEHRRQHLEKQERIRETQQRIYDAADIALANFPATSTNLWAVTKKRGVCDDEECHEFVIPLAVFESEKEAEDACLTFAEARAHHDHDVFEVKPMPFFKKGGAA